MTKIHPFKTWEAVFEQLLIFRNILICNDDDINILWFLGPLVTAKVRWWIVIFENNNPLCKVNSFSQHSVALWAGITGFKIDCLLSKDNAAVDNKGWDWTENSSKPTLTWYQHTLLYIFVVLATNFIFFCSLSCFLLSCLYTEIIFVDKS